MLAAVLTEAAQELFVPVAGSQGLENGFAGLEGRLLLDEELADLVGRARLAEVRSVAAA